MKVPLRNDGAGAVDEGVERVAEELKAYLDARDDAEKVMTMGMENIKLASMKIVIPMVRRQQGF